MQLDKLTKWYSQWIHFFYWGSHWGWVDSGFEWVGRNSLLHFSLVSLLLLTELVLCDKWRWDLVSDSLWILDLMMMNIHVGHGWRGLEPATRLTSYRISDWYHFYWLSGNNLTSFRFSLGFKGFSNQLGFFSDLLNRISSLFKKPNANRLAFCAVIKAFCADISRFKYIWIRKLHSRNPFPHSDQSKWFPSTSLTLL